MDNCSFTEATVTHDNVYNHSTSGSLVYVFSFQIKSWYKSATYVHRHPRWSSTFLPKLTTLGSFSSKTFIRTVYLYIVFTCNGFCVGLPWVVVIQLTMVARPELVMLFELRSITVRLHNVCKMLAKYGIPESDNLLPENMYNC